MIICLVLRLAGWRLKRIGFLAIGELPVRIVSADLDGDG